MKNLHMLLYCIYLERHKKILFIKAGISLYQWINRHKLYNYYENMSNLSIAELKKEIKIFLND